MPRRGGDGGGTAAGVGARREMRLLRRRMETVIEFRGVDLESAATDALSSSATAGAASETT